ncbi:MAG: ribbon-helix-helix domain-containing protein, partial [Solirubrobacteraceae bacterium]
CHRRRAPTSGCARRSATGGGWTTRAGGGGRARRRARAGLRLVLSDAEGDGGRAGRPIPSWYRDGMSIQIAVRLPDELVDFLDAQVRAGDAKSRATVVTRALQRERRRVIAARDAAILAASEVDADMDGLAAHVARAALDLG